MKLTSLNSYFVHEKKQKLNPAACHTQPIMSLSIRPSKVERVVLVMKGHCPFTS